MEIVKKMNIPAHDLFEVFNQSIKSDIVTEIGKKVSADDFEGYEYIKSFSKSNQAKIRIEKFEMGKSYHYSTTTDKNHIFIKYDVKSLDNQSCELKYSEMITSYGFFQKMNDTFVGIIWSYLKKKKFNEMLNQIESAYVKN